MKKIIILMLFILILSGCGIHTPTMGQASIPFQFITDPSIIKNNIIYFQDKVESTPIVFNGQLYSIVNGNLQPPNTSNTTYIDNMITHQHIASIPVGNVGFGSALVYNNKVYIFYVGAERSNGNAISYISSTDLINWTIPIIIYSDPNNHIYNPSIIHDGKQFVMAYETATPEIVKFASSADMINWTTVGKSFAGIDGTYAACPTIRYDTQYNKYYILYMAIVQGRFYTFITRTQDFISFENAIPVNNQIPFAPAADWSEGTNNSDVDLCEFNGKTYFLYAIGDQVSWLNMKTAVYNGSMIQYLRSSYPAP